jgi:NTP pyrophosphatase (non-canonical NTP hydrolase)
MESKMNVDLNRYQDFVAGVTSLPSNNLEVFVARCQELEEYNINVPLLITASMGMAAESGEFTELPKKILFQGKELTEESRFHMKRELGDIIWYWINACRALGLDPNDVIAENVTKLEARYPGGQFDVFFSENRANLDL